MKRTNNKFRNNNNNYNNQVYSLNYKFDSNSIAGKFSGTALDLIKRYNELAKDALNNNDYVSAEVFRQYAEHYRKIVTEINEKKNQNQKNNNPKKEEIGCNDNNSENTVSALEEKTDASENKVENSAPVENIPVKKEFKVIEISEVAELKENTEESAEAKQAKPKRTYRKKVEAV